MTFNVHIILTVYFVIVNFDVLVQQPMSGRSFTLFCLKKTHAKVKPLDVVLLYAHNDIPFLREVRKRYHSLINHTALQFLKAVCKVVTI